MFFYLDIDWDVEMSKIGWCSLGDEAHENITPWHLPIKLEGEGVCKPQRKGHILKFTNLMWFFAPFFSLVGLCVYI